MRTYQRVNSSNGFDAAINSLVFGTAIIWMPILALTIGYKLLEKQFEFGDYSPKRIAERKAEQYAYEKVQWEEDNRVIRDASGVVTWVNPKGYSQKVSNVLPITNPNSPKHGWLITAGGFTYALSDYRASCGYGEYRYTTYRTGGGQAGGGCYKLINSVIVLQIGERTMYFDKASAVEGFFLTDTEARKLGAVGVKKPVKKQTVAEAQAAYEKATEAYNLVCKYGCGGEPLKKWQKARDNLAVAVAG